MHMCMTLATWRFPPFFETMPCISGALSVSLALSSFCLPTFFSPRPFLVVVFQCDKCLVIVGDSLSWVQADETVGTITLSAMRSVKVREDSLQTSKAGKDIGWYERFSDEPVLDTNSMYC